MLLKSVEKKEKNKTEILVNVSHEEFDSAIAAAYIKNRKSIAVPGFRKGKAPRKIVEAMYGATVFHADALDTIIPRVFSFIAEEVELKLVGSPMVSNYDVLDEGGLELTLDAAVYPEVSIGEYKGLSAYKPPVEVDDKLVDSELESVRSRNARFEKVDRPAADGDIAVIDYEGFVDSEPFAGGKSEDYELELGSNKFIPGFEEKIVGMLTGEERDIGLVFPEDYTDELAGKPVIFKVKLNEIKEKTLPELDDEFAKDVSEFDTLEEYKAGIKNKLLSERQTTADADFENALLDKLDKTLEADIPEIMIEEQMDSMLRNLERQISAYGMTPDSYMKMMQTTPAALRESTRISAEKQVRIMLALEKIALLEAVEISEEEIENDFIEAAERYGAKIEELKENADRDALISDLKMRRAAKIVTDNAIALAEEPVEEAAEETIEESVKEPAKEPISETDGKSTEESQEERKTESAKKPKASVKTTEKKVSPKKPAAKKSATEQMEADKAEDKKPTEKAASKPKKKETSGQDDESPDQSESE